MEIIISIYNFFNHPIENGELYAIRKEIATIFQQSGFGEILEQNDKFSNEFLIPTNDEYLEDEFQLFESFVCDFPPLHGDIENFIMQGIPHLQDIIRRQFRLMIHVRIIFN